MQFIISLFVKWQKTITLHSYFSKEYIEPFWLAKTSFTFFVKYIALIILSWDLIYFTLVGSSQISECTEWNMSLKDSAEAREFNLFCWNNFSKWMYFQNGLTLWESQLIRILYIVSKRNCWNYRCFHWYYEKNKTQQINA